MTYLWREDLIPSFSWLPPGKHVCRIHIFYMVPNSNLQVCILLHNRQLSAVDPSNNLFKYVRVVPRYFSGVVLFHVLWKSLGKSVDLQILLNRNFVYWLFPRIISPLSYSVTVSTFISPKFVHILHFQTTHIHTYIKKTKKLKKPPSRGWKVLPQKWQFSIFKTTTTINIYDSISGNKFIQMLVVFAVKKMAGFLMNRSWSRFPINWRLDSIITF